MGHLLTRYRTAMVAAVLVLFGTAMAVLSFGNHLCFRTYGLDLGIYTKAAYDYSRLRANDCSFFLWEPSNILADHFDLLLVVLSPLVRLGGAWALLTVQLLAVLAGALGVYKLANYLSEVNVVQNCASSLKTHSLKPTAILVPSLLMLLPLLSFGTWHALGFDYHSNVVGAMMLPWLILFVERRKLWPAVAMAVLIAICKESSALWLCFVLAALLPVHWRDKGLRRGLGIGLGVATVYLAVVTLWVMPSLGGSSRGFWRYEWMGGSFSDVARWLVTHPFEALRDLFINFTHEADCDHLKHEFYVCFLLSGGLCCLLRPHYLIMLLPPLALKMLAATPSNFWGVNFHYNVELCMVACVATVDVVCRRERNNELLATVFVLLTAATLVYTVNNPVSEIRRANTNIFAKEHYRQYDIDVHAACRMLRQIPPDASVCATTMFTPHLATRDSIYIFPLGMSHATEYYMIRRNCWSYYDNDAELAAQLIADTAAFSIVDSADNLYLLHRR